MTDGDGKIDDKDEEHLTPVASPWGKKLSSRSIRAAECCPLCKGERPDPRAEPCEVCGGDRFSNDEVKLTAWRVRFELWKGRHPEGSQR